MTPSKSCSIKYVLDKIILDQIPSDNIVLSSPTSHPDTTPSMSFAWTKGSDSISWTFECLASQSIYLQVKSNANPSISKATKMNCILYSNN